MAPADPEPNRAAPPDDAELFDFLDEYARDLERGAPKGLRDYLARYPGHEEAVAREFVRLKGGAEALERAPSEVGAAPEAGERRIGPYRLVRELGAGGQGAVWLCEDTRIARAVALKFMPSSFALLSADRRRRMQREAEVVSRLEHPSICPVYEAQIDHDPPYIAMRFVEGETLAGAIARAHKGDRSGPLPLPPRNGVELRRVLLFVERAARALHAAHEAGVIHRDIKPGNVMVTREGEPVLLDFGQARDERADVEQRTLSGEVFGTPMYMSPEQVAGSASGVDRRTDVWSLGASLFEALTLARPFLGESVTAILLAIQSEPLPPVRRMNTAIEEDAAVVLETALEKDVQRRYATALEFAEDLRRVREYEPIRARAAGPIVRLRRWAQRQPALAASIALVIGSLTVGLVWTLHLLGREQDALDATAAALEREGDAKDEALDALRKKEEALAGKEQMLHHALARHLAGRSIEWLSEDPAFALALGLFAHEIEPCYQTRAAILPALDACRLARQLYGGPAARLVLDMDLMRDSQRVAAVLDDCRIQVWNLRSGEELVAREHPLWEATLVRAHPSGAWVATAGEDDRVRVFDATSGELVREMEAPEPGVVALEIDASGEQVALLTRGGALAVLDANSGRERARTRFEAARFNSLEFSEDGRYLLAAHLDPGRRSVTLSKTAAVCDTLDARVLGELRMDGATITSAAFDPAGEHVATASEAGAVQLWKLPECARTWTPLEHDAPVSCVAFSRDGSRLIAATETRGGARLEVWSLASGDRLAFDGGHDSRIHAIDVCLDGRRFVTTSRDTLIRTWSLDGQPLASFDAWVRPIETRWTPDGQRMVTLGAAPFFPVWWGEDPPDVYRLVGHRGAVRSVEFDARGEFAVTAADDGTARLWRTPRYDEPRGAHAPGEQIALFEQPGVHVTSAQFDALGNVVTLSREGVVGLWNARSGEFRSQHEIEGAALSAATAGEPLLGTVLAVLSDRGRVHVFHAGCLPSEARVFDDAATCFALSNAGERLVVGRRDASLRVYRTSDGSLELERSWPAPIGGEAVVALDLRADEAQVAVAGGDTWVRLYDLDANASAAPSREIITFPMLGVSYNRTMDRLLAVGPRGRAAIRLIELSLARDRRPRIEVFHADDMTSGSFDPSGELVLTTSRDGSALVRESSTGEPTARFDRHGAAVTCGAFSRDGGAPRVISGAENGVVCVWPVDPLPAARARKPREIREWEHAREARFAAPLEYPVRTP